MEDIDIDISCFTEEDEFEIMVGPFDTSTEGIKQLKETIDMFKEENERLKMR